MSANPVYGADDARIIPCIRTPWKGPFKRIVAGFGRDSLDSQAFRLALTIARDCGAKLEIVTSTSPTSEMAPLSGYITAAEVDLSLSSQKLAFTHELEKNSMLAGCAWESVIAIGDPADLILKTAKQRAADLIVVGSHGRHGLESFLVGSISHEVLNQACCPVLVLGPECEASGDAPQTILFATDLEATGAEPARHAIELADDNKSKLIALHVLEEKAPARGRQREWIEDDCREKLRLRMISDIAEDVEKEYLVAYGSASEEILAAAGRVRADLIVLGVGNHGSMGDHSPLSTVADIVRSAACPVLNVSNSRYVS